MCSWASLACVIIGSYSSRNHEYSLGNRVDAIQLFSFSFLLSMLSAAAVHLYHTASFWRCGRHGTTPVAVRLQGLFVTAANAASVLARVFMWACHPEHSEGRFQPTLPLHFKSIRVIVQQRYNSNSSGTTPANLARLLYIRTPVLSLFNLRHPRDTSTTSRRGTLYV